jgi:hypothetical protein
MMQKIRLRGLIFQSAKVDFAGSIPLFKILKEKKHSRSLNRLMNGSCYFILQVSNKKWDAPDFASLALISIECGAWKKQISLSRTYVKHHEDSQKNYQKS